MDKEFLPPLHAETKSAPFALFKKDNIKGERTRAGIFAVLGNRDQAGDRTQPGAFTKTWKDNKHNIVHLFDHGQSGVTAPIAAVDDLYEIGKADLPDEVLQLAPDATGGAVVVRTYVKSDLGEHHLNAVDIGATKQMSFAYGIPKGKDEIIKEQIKGEMVSTRLIKEVKQYDTSDVRWGCNGATIAQLKSLFNPAVDLEELYKRLQTIEAEFKSGARNSAKDSAMMKQIHDLAKSLDPACCAPDPVEPDADDELKQFQFALAMAKASRQHFHVTQPSR